MTPTIRRYQLPHAADDGTIEIETPRVRQVLSVEEIGSTPYLTLVVDDEETPLRKSIVIARRANQEGPMHAGDVSTGPYPYAFIGVLGIHYFFWKGDA